MTENSDAEDILNVLSIMISIKDDAKDRLLC